MQKSLFKEVLMFAVNHLLFSKPVDEFRLVVEQEGLPLLSGYQGFRDFYFATLI